MDTLTITTITTITVGLATTGETGMPETLGIVAIAGGQTAGMAPGPAIVILETGDMLETDEVATVGVEMDAVEMGMDEEAAIALSRRAMAQDSGNRVRSSVAPDSRVRLSTPVTPALVTRFRTAGATGARRERVMPGNRLSAMAPGKTTRRPRRSSYRTTGGHPTMPGEIARTAISVEMATTVNR
jgi:hypothetical protein